MTEDKDKDKNHKLTLLDGKKEDNATLAMKKAVEDMRNRLPVIIQALEIDAKLVMAKFEALVKAGFTEEQALELCKESQVKI